MVSTSWRSLAVDLMLAVAMGVFVVFLHRAPLWTVEIALPQTAVVSFLLAFTLAASPLLVAWQEWWRRAVVSGVWWFVLMALFGMFALPSHDAILWLVIAAFVGGGMAAGRRKARTEPDMPGEPGTALPAMWQRFPPLLGGVTVGLSVLPIMSGIVPVLVTLIIVLFLGLMMGVSRAERSVAYHIRHGLIAAGLMCGVFLSK
jgi:hypothetical protein